MTAVEQVLQQIERLSPAEKAAVRKHLEGSEPTGSAPPNHCANLHDPAACESNTQLWGLFADDADELDSIVASALQARQSRPLRLP
jgi:hypothetical protein